MLHRINRAVLLFAACLIAAGGVAVQLQSGGHMLVDLKGFARPWLLLIVGLGTFPLLSWWGYAAVSLYGRGKPWWAGAAATAWTIVMINLVFWGSVQARIPPVKHLFDTGRLVWIGPRAFLFGHGFWRVSDGYWQHQTLVRLPDGTMYQGPTLDLLNRLHDRGAESVWGSWCYSGNYPYIRMDLVTGKREPWPSYVSYNRAPGLTIPVWLGSSFVRLGWQKDRYVDEPATHTSLPPDTLFLMRPSLDRIEEAFSLMQQRIPGLPRPDSVSWRPVVPDTVRSITRLALAALPPDERRQVKEWERAALREQAKTGVALYWIGGRALPLSVSVSPRLYRTFEELQLAARDGNSADRYPVEG